jgi:glucose/arabinose dehydrogenase
VKRGLLLAALVAAGCGGDNGTGPSTSDCQPVAGTPPLTTRRVAQGFSKPLDLQSVPGDRSRLFVVEQPGRIRIVRSGNVLSTPFLDVSARVGSSGDEQGLLGLAFHPRYSENGRFFVNYTDRGGDTHIAEFRVSSNPDVADPDSERLLLFVDQPFSNHNGGGLAFGPDGFLYIGLGDGGSGGDPQGNGQNLGTPLGKLLRIDVDRGSPFTVPSDNPFASRPGAFGPIWAYGLRNPWRFAFDRANGNLLIADVGQNAWEEVDLGSSSRRGGENYGWNVTEGNHCFRPASGCSSSGLTLPIFEYDHNQGCSITGGVVYRGCRMPGYQGTYFFSDYCTSFIKSFRIENGAAVDVRDWTSSLGRGLDNVTSFGTDADGEVYIVDRDGEVYQIVPQG